MNVYVIASEGGMCKIGKARDPEGRLAALLTGHPFEMHVAHVFRFETDDEAYRVERAAHAKLSEFRMKGEWFSVSPEDAKEAINQILHPVSMQLAVTPSWMMPDLIKAMVGLSSECFLLAKAIDGAGFGEKMGEEIAARLHAVADRLSTNFRDDL